ncbi:menaquinone biosynthesis prenyltransferase MqnP [Helicobacter cetorum]|uniref:menaquinone biosynthesis prenyltransferase MqnP n=1 Tax=Helicobacter cetorum TaxID=138563 RepID=UPI001E39B251|nr:menaquinone biosynthesis prenyltransferase MqnP [Helicobacter cetorum]
MKALSELVALEHTIFSSMFLFIAMVVSSYQKNQTLFFGIEILILCSLALLSARNFAMGFNRLVDRDIDKDNPRTKNRPSVDGRISVKSMVIFSFSNALLFVVVSYCINTLAFKLSLPFLIILGGYSYFKRFSSLAHFIVGLALGLAPIAGSVAILGAIPLWNVFLALGVMLWVAGFDLLYSLQDMEFDKKRGLHSIPSKLGEEWCLNFSRLSHLLALICWLGFVKNYDGGLFAYLGLGVSALILLYEQILVTRDYKNIPKAFFVSNGYLGVIFFIFIVLDVGLKHA